MGTVTGWGATGVGEWADSRVPARKRSVWQVAASDKEGGKEEGKGLGP